MSTAGKRRTEAFDDDWNAEKALLRLDETRFGQPKVGIFAQRGKNRPNLLGVSRCRLLAVDGLDLHVRGLDAIDSTPVLDIKPYMAEFGPQGPTFQPEWATELMRTYY